MGSLTGPLGLLQASPGEDLNPKTAKFAQIPLATLGYVERVRSQFLSLRH
jgi:hypothetical protein